MTVAVSRTDTGLIAALRRDLDVEHRRAAAAEARARELELVVAEQQRERAELQAALLCRAEEAQQSGEPADVLGAERWRLAHREARRLLGERALELVKRDRWLKEFGEELAALTYRNTLLQAIVDAVRGCRETDRLGEIQVHLDRHSGSLFEAIDFVGRAAR